MSKLTTEEAILRFRSIHGNKYEYNLTKFDGMLSKISIFCSKCNKNFEQRACNHSGGNGCPFCKKRVSREINKKTLKTEVILKLFKHLFKVGDTCAINKACIPNNLKHEVINKPKSFSKYKELLLGAVLNNSSSFIIKVGVHSTNIHILVTDVQFGGTNILRTWLVFNNISKELALEVKSNLKEYLSEQVNFDNRLLQSLIPKQWEMKQPEMREISKLRINKANSSCLAFSLPMLVLLLEFFKRNHSHKEYVEQIKIKKEGVKIIVKVKHFSELLCGVSARNDRSSYENYWKQLLNLTHPLLIVSNGSSGINKEFIYKKKGLISFVGKRKDLHKSNLKLSIDPLIVSLYLDHGSNSVKKRKLTYGSVPFSITNSLNKYKYLRRWHYVSLGWVMNQKKWNESSPRELLIEKAIRIWEIPNIKKQHKKKALSRVKECLYYMFALGCAVKSDIICNKILVYLNPYLLKRFKY